MCCMPLCYFSTPSTSHSGGGGVGGEGGKERAGAKARAERGAGVSGRRSLHVSRLGEKRGVCVVKSSHPSCVRSSCCVCNTQNTSGQPAVHYTPPIGALLCTQPLQLLACARVATSYQQHTTRACVLCFLVNSGVVWLLLQTRQQSQYTHSATTKQRMASKQALLLYMYKV